MRRGLSLLIAVLLAWSAVPGASVAAESLSALRQGLALVDAGRPAEAAALAARLEAPVLRAVIEWYRLGRAPHSADFADYEAFLTRFPDWPEREHLLRHAQAAMPSDLAPQRVAAWFARFPARDAEAALRHLAALHRLGEAEAAAAEARRVWRELPLTAAQEAALLADHGTALRVVDHRVRLARLFETADYDAAARSALLLEGDEQMLALMRLRLARLEETAGEAVALLPAALRQDPELLFEWARYRLRRDERDTAADLLDPGPPNLSRRARQWWTIRQESVRRLLRHNDSAGAYRIAARHGTEAGEVFEEAEFLAGWIALERLGDARRAYAHFDRLFHGAGHEATRARAAFWAAEASAVIGRDDWAEQWHRVAARDASSFYGQQSAERLGLDPQAAAGPSFEPPEARRRAFAARPLVAAIRALHAVGRDALLSPFFTALRGQSEEALELRLIGELAAEVGRPDEMLRSGRAALALGGSLDPLDALLYPLPSLHLPPGADAPLILSVIRQESAFDPRAVSPAGARGLMQLMPSTAIEVSARLGEFYALERLTEDPAFNLRLGQDYLQAMLHRYDGLVPLALAAYNAGPGRVDDWIDRFGDPRRGEIELLYWIERIPFDETRNYVQRVLEVARVYQRQLTYAN